MQNPEMPVTNEQIAKLRSLRAVGKFDSEPSSLYWGAPSEELGDQYNGHANDLIDELLASDSPLSENQVFDAFRRVLTNFEIADTEDKERICSVLEQIMDILKIESSGGLLNEWLYGFDPTQL